MKKIILGGDPKSTNHIYKYVCRGRHSCMYMTAEGKTLKNRYGWQAKAQWDKPLLTGKVKLVIRLFFGTKRRQDIDNFNKLILDALTGIIWEDDSQIQELKIIKDYDKAEPRIEIEIL